MEMFESVVGKFILVFVGREESVVIILLQSGPKEEAKSLIFFTDRGI